MGQMHPALPPQALCTPAREPLCRAIWGWASRGHFWNRTGTLWPARHARRGQLILRFRLCLGESRAGGIISWGTSIQIQYRTLTACILAVFWHRCSLLSVSFYALFSCAPIVQ